MEDLDLWFVVFCQPWALISPVHLGMSVCECLRVCEMYCTYVKLPALYVLASVLVGDDDDELGDLAADHPLVQLGHDLLDVGLDLVVRGD